MFGYRSNSDIITSWIQQHFSDQKLAEVYAFNQDGKMSYSDPCACLLGVTGSEYPHNLESSGCQMMHYIDMRFRVPGAAAAESAYLTLGFSIQNQAMAFQPDTPQGNESERKRTVTR